MLKVGLTGSIAVGKSFVCSVLADFGCHVLDADRTARDVVRPGTSGLESIIEKFGSGVLREDGELDRSALAAVVFADAEMRLILNSIVHPLVIAAQDEWLRGLELSDPEAIAVIDAALMIESGGYKRFDKLIVVWCEPAIQLTRLMLRENLETPAAQKRIGAQMSQDEKKRYADYLIDTSAGFAEATRHTEAVFKQLKQLQRHL